VLKNNQQLISALNDNATNKVIAVMNTVEGDSPFGHYCAMVIDKKGGHIQIINKIAQAHLDKQDRFDYMGEIFKSIGSAPTVIKYEPQSISRQDYITQRIDLHCGIVATFNALVSVGLTSKKSFLEIPQINAITTHATFKNNAAQ
jgi:hypothetical protein